MDKYCFSDQELVTRYIDGDKKAFEALVQRHKHKVYNYIFMMLRNHALSEDIFQDTFIKALKSLKEGKYHDDGKIISWLMRIAHNLIIDHFRKQKRLQTVNESKCDLSLANMRTHSVRTIEDEIIENQIHSDAVKLLDYLPIDQKEVVLLRLYGGLSFKEIADQTNVSLNTALGRMRYALLNLRKLVAEKGIVLSS